LFYATFEKIIVMNFDVQPTLENDLIKIQPLKPTDFETLYAIASNPLLWEQHPNKDRYKRDIFETFFKGAMESNGAFLVFDNKAGKAIGTSRFYGIDNNASSVAIGYTFVARDCWGKGYNKALKILMINYAFQFVDNVIFHVGAVNVRSQKAVGNIGGKKISELEMEYYGEPSKLNYIYKINKIDWQRGKTTNMQRPNTDEYNPFFQDYINQTSGDNFFELFKQNTNDTLQFFTNIPAVKHNYAYAENKWTIKQVLLHLIDAERVFSYRAFVGARCDSEQQLQSFDENTYVENSHAHLRSMESLLEEFKIVRRASEILFENITTNQSKFMAKGTTHPITPRALGYIMIGHVQHHLEIIKNRYL
jgi:RimJ/RimL family protein N-acetyltransferase